MNINTAHVCGRVTRDPELKALPSGSKVVSFSLATNYTYKTESGEKKEIVEFHNCKAFGKPAETIAMYVKKGSELYVQGRIQTQKWEKDDVKHNRTEIIIEKFQFGAKAKGAETAEKAEKTNLDEEFPDEEINPDDIPF